MKTATRQRVKCECVQFDLEIGKLQIDSSPSPDTVVAYVDSILTICILFFVPGIIYVQSMATKTKDIIFFCFNSWMSMQDNRVDSLCAIGTAWYTIYNWLLCSLTCFVLMAAWTTLSSEILCKNKTTTKIIQFISFQYNKNIQLKVWKATPKFNVLFSLNKFIYIKNVYNHSHNEGTRTNLKHRKKKNENICLKKCTQIIL